MSLPDLQRKIEQLVIEIDNLDADINAMKLVATVRALSNTEFDTLLIKSNTRVFKNKELEIIREERNARLAH